MEISSQQIEERAKDVNLTPTIPQAEAGNYKMAHISVKGMRISIENPKGSKRYYGEPDENGKSFKENSLINAPLLTILSCNFLFSAG